MSDHTHSYVRCDVCQFEARKDCSGSFTGYSESPPMGWLHVDNRDRKKLWDICPDCAKAFTQWLLDRATKKLDDAHDCDDDPDCQRCHHVRALDRARECGGGGKP